MSSGRSFRIFVTLSRLIFISSGRRFMSSGRSFRIFITLSRLIFISSGRRFRIFISLSWRIHLWVWVGVLESWSIYQEGLIFMSSGRSFSIFIYLSRRIGLHEFGWEIYNPYLLTMKDWSSWVRMEVLECLSLDHEGLIFLSLGKIFIYPNSWRLFMSSGRRFIIFIS